MSLVTARGITNSDAAATRNAPSSNGVKTTSPRFIRMKEVPQTDASRIKRISAVVFRLDDVDIRLWFAAAKIGKPMKN